MQNSLLDYTRFGGSLDCILSSAWAKWQSGKVWCVTGSH